MESSEALQQAAEVAGVFGAGEADLLARAEHHVHLVRLGLLHLGQQVAVEGELQHVRRLGVAPELGVDDFVAVVAEGGGLVHLAQEVRVADEVAVQERGLVDDRRAGAHGGQRLGCGLARGPGTDWRSRRLRPRPGAGASTPRGTRPRTRGPCGRGVGPGRRAWCVCALSALSSSAARSSAVRCSHSWKFTRSVAERSRRESRRCNQ